MVLQVEQSILETSVATVTTALVSILGLQKITKIWKGSSAELDLIKTMHEELSRLGEYNKTLSEELGKVQKDFLALNREIRGLSDENQQLHSEVVALTLEVKRLKGLIKTKKEPHAERPN